MNLQNNLSNNNKSSLKVLVKRGSSVESIHRAHASICDTKGRTLMKAGLSEYETFIRSALKPFQVLPFLTSGTSEKYNLDNKALALACGSHQGSADQARTAFKLLWNADIDIKELKCPIPANRESKLQHNCSGKHSAFLATCKKMNWDLDSYLMGHHPLQKEIFRRVSELLKIPAEELIAERDDCGAPTLLLHLSQMAVLYAHLSKSDQPEFERIARAMTNNPDLVAGKGCFDSELIKRGHNQIISKGGSEGIQCIGLLGEGIGLSIKVEDGSRRAKHAVAIHLLRQLEWISPTALEELDEIILQKKPGIYIEVEGQLKVP
ncbi:asparaginase [Prochlorococcus marinus]|uniref:Asparaginase n=1 Tax=Prochlorococcus marinus XMU1408 TaxID=2213228 RepID=A0A318R5B6_PROMR|nr:asparaginase [Prochlorococcus marinus]MBW3041850.1 asparaginase [Prochlorococcus marinus str. XMU1408]PYE02988.1 asparaginase [Prochlorococcus marinus XMU1408]